MHIGPLRVLYYYMYYSIVIIDEEVEVALVHKICMSDWSKKYFPQKSGGEKNGNTPGTSTIKSSKVLDLMFPVSFHQQLWLKNRKIQRWRSGPQCLILWSLETELQETQHFTSKHWKYHQKALCVMQRYLFEVGRQQRKCVMICVFPTDGWNCTENTDIHTPKLPF